MSAKGNLAERAAELRRAFDQTFAEAAQLAREDLQNFLAIRVAGDPYGVPLAGLAGLYADRTVVAVPSRTPALLGISGFRGVVAPVYDLRPLLGYPSDESSGSRLRWLLLIGGANPIGFAFELFEAQLRVSRDAVATPLEGKNGATQGTLHEAGIERPVLNLHYLCGRVAASGKSQDF